MRYVLMLLMAVTISVQPVIAQGLGVSFDGEQFKKKFVATPPNGDRLLEFVREGETFDNWTKLVAFRYQQLPKEGNDPKTVASGMFKVVKADNPNALVKLFVSTQKSEAIIDFLTWPKNENYLEFNIFRYAKSADGKAIVSLQFAYRMPHATSANGLKTVKEHRTTWINEVAQFDMDYVSASLAKKEVNGGKH